MSFSPEAVQSSTGRIFGVPSARSPYADINIAQMLEKEINYNASFTLFKRKPFRE